MTSKSSTDRLKKELDSRFKRLVEWLNQSDLRYGVILKEEIDVQRQLSVLWRSVRFRGVRGNHRRLFRRAHGDSARICSLKVKESGVFEKVVVIRQ